MKERLFNDFRLVGGTSLSLQWGHRISLDIDLFSDASYGSIDFDSIDAFLRKTFPYVSNPNAGVIGMGRSYFIGKNQNTAIKLDLYYTDPFIRPYIIEDEVRMATVEEIIAMKIDILQREGRKKDFWDLDEGLEIYSPEKMIVLHAERYPYTHDESLIRKNFSNFSNADQDFDPQCLRGKFWELIKLNMIERVV